MTTVVKSNFVTVDSFLLSMRASLRQALIRKLAHVKSPDQAAWMKAEDYIAGLLNDDQMLTLETTDHAIKIFENCASRAIEPTTVLPAGASPDDPVAVMLAMQAQIVELRAFNATLTPAVTPGPATRKKARVHNPAEPKAALTCPVCKQHGHDTERCWVHAENKIAEAAKMKSDAEAVLQSKHKKAFMAGFAANDPDDV